MRLIDNRGESNPLLIIIIIILLIVFLPGIALLGAIAAIPIFGVLLVGGIGIWLRYNVSAKALIRFLIVIGIIGAIVGIVLGIKHVASAVKEKNRINTNIEDAIKQVEMHNYGWAIKIIEDLESEHNDSNEIREKLVTESIKNADIGSIIYFGLYDFKGNSYSKKKVIEWYVIEKEDNKLLLLSKDVEDKPFGVDYYSKDYTSNWTKSPIRDWCNLTFYNMAFNQYEKNMVLDTSHSDCGVTDKVFFLSVDEISACLEKCPDIEYPYSSWWLRTSGSTKKKIKYMKGKEIDEQEPLWMMSEHIRPALWINTESIK